MKRLPVVCLLALCLASIVWAGPVSVSMPSFWRYAHPEAKALVGIEWQRIVNSPLGQEIRQKVSESKPVGMEELDIFDSIGRIFISSPGSPDGAGAGQQPPAVVAVQGNFDLVRVRQLAAEKAAGAHTYQGVEILDQDEPGKPPMGLALVSDQVLLLGDTASVEGAIDHYFAGDPGQASNPLFLRASELAATNDIWIVAKASPSDFSQGGAEQLQFLKDVESLEAGVSLQNGLGLQLNLGANDPQSAAELAAGMKLMLGMFLASAPKGEGAPDLSQKLQIAADESYVKLALQLDRNELQSTFRQFSTAAASTMMAEAEVSEGAAPDQAQAWTWEPANHVQPEPQPKDLKIRIYGLEDGTREIEMNR